MKKLRKIKLPPPPIEDVEAEWLAAWLRGQGIKFGHIANENKATNALTAKIRGAARWRLGVSKGMPDYLIIIPFKVDEMTIEHDAEILFIELKRQRRGGSVTSPEQKEWIATLEEIPGVTAAICYGFEEARDLVNKLRDRKL